MFEDYLTDATCFLNDAREAAKSGERGVARRNYRAAIIVGAAAMETFVNYIANTLELAGEAGLKQYELALLLDRRFGQSEGHFGIQDQVVYSRLEDKLRFLIERFAIDLDFGVSPAWAHFMQFKGLRDSLVHSKKDEDDTGLEDYDLSYSRGIRASVELMEVLSKGIFKKPLRANLIDLIPADPT